VVLSALTKVGLRREASWGAGGSPTVCLPVDSPGFTVPYEQLLDNSVRGIAAVDFAAYQGVGHVEGSLSGPAYPEELGYLLLCALGSCSTSGTAAPYTHTFSLDSSPPSLAIQDENDVETWRYTGCNVSELTITFNAAEGLVTYSADFVGKEREEPTDEPIPADATNAPFRGWMISAAVGTSDPFGKIIEGEMSFSREVEQHYLDGNSQYPQAATVGPLEVTGRCTILFDSAADYARYLSKTQEAFVLTFNYGNGADEKELKITCSNMDFGDGAAEIDRGDQALKLSYTMRALYNSTDGGPCQVTLKNSKSSYSS